jgi:hypothetical protein
VLLLPVSGVVERLVLALLRLVEPLVLPVVLLLLVVVVVVVLVVPGPAGGSEVLLTLSTVLASAPLVTLLMLVEAAALLLALFLLPQAAVTSAAPSSKAAAAVRVGRMDMKKAPLRSWAPRDADGGRRGALALASLCRPSAKSKGAAGMPATPKP